MANVDREKKVEIGDFVNTSDCLEGFNSNVSDIKSAVTSYLFHRGAEMTLPQMQHLILILQSLHDVSRDFLLLCNEVDRFGEYK